MKYKSLFDMWKQSCLKYSDKVAFTDYRQVESLTYKQAFRELCFLAEKFKDIGFERFDHICLFAVNFPRWLVLEQAIITLGAVCVSKTSDLNISELDYVFRNSDSVGLITDNIDIVKHFAQDKEILDRIKVILYTGSENIDIQSSKILYLKNILSELTDETPVKTDWEENPEDVAYLNYTSGTSASPKGAMLPNIGMSYVVEQLQYFNDVKADKLFIGIFPLSSAGGKSINLLCFTSGCKVMFAQYRDFYEVIDNQKPDYFHLAPKIIQTIHSKMMAYVKSQGIIFENVFNLAFNICSSILQQERKNKNKKNCPIGCMIKNIIDKNIFKKVRTSLFKEESVLFIGSAHLAKPLEDFLSVMNIKFVQHYGLTETTGLAVSNTLESQKKYEYSVGIPFEGTTLKIINPETHEELPRGEVGLITLQGPEILKKYYKNEEATNKAIFEGHALNTGDLGYVNNDGYLYVLSRYDDVIVLSNGYNVYTPLLENEAKDSEYINQIVITGQGKPYLTSLIVLNQNEYENWCTKNNKANHKNPNTNEEFKAFLIEHLNEKIKRKSEYRYYEKIKKVHFLNETFTVENGMLTGTLKVKYQKIVNSYKNEIEKLYEDD